MLTNPHRKKWPCCEKDVQYTPRTWTDPLLRTKQWKRDTKFGKKMYYLQEAGLGGGGGMPWIELAHVMGRWRAFVNGVMFLRIA